MILPEQLHKAADKVLGERFYASVCKNTISEFMKCMKENSPLPDMCPEKRLSNHSVRKTVVRVPKSELITITGHRQEP